MLQSPHHCNALLRLLRQEFDADFAVMSLLEADGQTFIHHAVTPHTDRPEILRLARDPKSLCSQVAEEGRPIVVPNVADAAPGSACAVMRAEGLVSYLGVPLVDDGTVIGALEVMTRMTRHWTPEDQRKIEDFARLMLAKPQQDLQEAKGHLRVVR